MPVSWAVRALIRQLIQVSVAALIALARAMPAARWLLTSSAKWRPCRLSRKAQVASGLHPVIPAMKVRAMSQARSGSAWWLMVPKNPNRGSASLEAWCWSSWLLLLASAREQHFALVRRQAKSDRTENDREGGAAGITIEAHLVTDAPSPRRRTT